MIRRTPLVNQVNIWSNIGKVTRFSPRLKLQLANNSDSNTKYVLCESRNTVTSCAHARRSLRYVYLKLRQCVRKTKLRPRGEIAETQYVSSDSIDSIVSNSRSP